MRTAKAGIVSANRPAHAASPISQETSKSFHQPLVNVCVNQKSDWASPATAAQASARASCSSA
jgi:hypothetical protein